MNRGSFFKQVFSSFKEMIVQQPGADKPEPAAALPAETGFTDGLTAMETAYCHKAGLPVETGLLLKSLTRRPVEKLVFEDYDTETTKPSGICSVTTDETARAIVFRHRDELLLQNQYIFLHEILEQGYRVGILGATTDPYEIIRLTETHGTNHGIMTGDIIKKLKKWDAGFGIRIFGIGFNFCECEIINKDIDYMALAEEIYPFCPDVVDQGTTTTTADLAEEIKRTGCIFLWWD